MGRADNGGGTAQGGGQASRQPDPTEASGVTNPDWQAIISGGSQTRPDASGNLSVDDAVSTVNVYVESVKEVEIQGADVNVYWVSGNPTVTGDGANHNVTQITR